MTRFAPPCKGPRSISLSLPPSLPTSCWLYLPKPPPEPLVAAAPPTAHSTTATTEQPNNLLLPRRPSVYLNCGGGGDLAAKAKEMEKGLRGGEGRKEARLDAAAEAKANRDFNAHTCKIRLSFHHSPLYFLALGMTGHSKSVWELFEVSGTKRNPSTTAESARGYILKYLRSHLQAY